MKKLLLLIIVAAMLVPCAFAQPATANSKVTVNVGPEAGLTIGGDATLTSGGTLFANYAGTSNFTYFVRTGATAGHITLAVTTDFSSGAGPSVATSGTTGDTLTYTPTVVLPATNAPAGTPAVMAPSSSAVATIPASSNSAKSGNSGSVAWTLINDPAYPVGSYSAVVTWTISVA